MKGKVFSNIPMSCPNLTELEIEIVTRVLRTNRLSIGPQIEAFEKAIATYVGSKYAIGVSSGTAGLHLAVIAAGVGERDLVITPSFSFIASANVVLYERAVPIFVDVDPKTGNINPDLLTEAIADINSGRKKQDRWLPPMLRGQSSKTSMKIKAILPVHAYGQPADMDPILATAKQFNISVIEDACEAIGSVYKNRKVGTLGKCGVFAFYPNKQITTGEGGMIVTDDNEWYSLFHSLRNQGRDIFDAWLNHSRLGYNYRLDEMSAALGTVQMSRIEELLTKREKVASLYSARLKDLEGVEIPYMAPFTTRMSWFVYVIRLSPKINRYKVIKELETKGIPSRPYFSPIHLQPFYIEKFGYDRGDFPVTEYLGDVSLALPFSGVMKEEQVDYVCRNLIEILQKT
jgi:dTDP-4-amino-4,6-dideoxygalactose transaminase